MPGTGATALTELGGGGGTVGFAKAVGILAANGGRTHDHEGIQVLSAPPVPMIAVPATAGTGSEVSGLCVTTNTTRRPKTSIHHAALNPAGAATLDSLALLAAKAGFYDALVRGCGNALVGELLGRLHRRVMVLRATSMSRPERLPASLRELRALADALIGRDARAAERLAIAHIRATEAAALPMLQEDTP